MPAAGTPFIRQADDYSCGAACLATVANLYGVSRDYGFFRSFLSPDPQTGSCNLRMIAASEAHLPFRNAGEGSYEGGVAIANVIAHGEGHYVVFLARDGDEITYYDPWPHAVIAANVADIVWTSETGHLKRWTVNYAPLDQDAWRRFM